MKKVIELDTLRVEIRGAKYREVKEIIRNSKMLVAKAKEVGQKIAEQDIQESEHENQSAQMNWGDELIEFLIENMDEVMELVARFTNLSREQLEDVEIPELVILIDHILKINRINLKKTYDFLYKLWKENGQSTAPVKSFVQTI